MGLAIGIRWISDNEVGSDEVGLVTEGGNSDLGGFSSGEGCTVGWDDDSCVGWLLTGSVDGWWLPYGGNRVGSRKRGWIQDWIWVGSYEC